MVGDATGSTERREDDPDHAVAQCGRILGAAVFVLAGCSPADAPDRPMQPPLGPPASTTESVVINEDLTARQVFPITNWWNLDVSQAPLDPDSQAFIDWISGRTPEDPTATRRLHPDFGPPPYGIPYVVVSGDQPRVPVTFISTDEATAERRRSARCPIPMRRARSRDTSKERGRWRRVGDRHCLVIDRDRWILFETTPRGESDALPLGGGIGAIWRLFTNERRPETWTSADAAGLAIFPGLIRYDTGVRHGRDPSRVSIHDACHERLCLAGVA
jgi:hypothetical protein